MDKKKSAPAHRPAMGERHQEAVDIQAVRSRLVDKGLIYFAVIVPLALGLSLARIFEHGWSPIYLLHVGLTGLIITGAVFRKRLPYSVRACLLLGQLLVFGAAGLANFGLVGGGLLLLFTFAGMSAIAFGTRAGLVACVIDIVILAVVGVAACTGRITFSFDIAEYATSPTAWSLMTVVFFMFAPMIVVAFGVVHEHLAESLQDVRRSHAKHERLVDNLAETFLYRYDVQGVFNYVSSSVTPVLGYSTEEFETHFTEYLTEHPVNREVVKCAKQSVKGFRQPPYEVQIYHKNGSVRWLEVAETPVRDGSGGVVSVEGVAHDITARKGADEALRKAMGFSDTLVQTSPAFIVAIDCDGRVRIMNEAMLAALGYSTEEVVGKDYLHNFVPEEDWVKLDAIFDHLTQAGEPTTNENRVLARNGRELLVEWHGRPVFDKDGSMDFFIGVGVDITERKSLEEQFQQAQKMEAVGQLAGGVAHDFNNLLQAILGYGEIALEESKGRSTHADLEQVVKAAESAAALVRQLLAFSRKQELELEEMDLGEVVSDLAKMIRRVIGEHIAFTIHSDPGLKAVRADKGQLEQLLMNLCVNARDAMAESGALTIDIGNTQLDDEFCEANAWAQPGRYVLLSVTDTGCGMDDETKRRIFEPFFTTKELGKGTGLGLSTVFGIVRQHKGMVNVYSEAGVGTAFRIYLPMAERAEAECEEAASLSSPGGTETILLVDDDDGVRRVALRMLEKAGYTVLTANDGEEAIRVFDEHADEVDLALLDVVMPKLGGKAVFDHIQEGHSQTRVLFASGYSAGAIHSGFVLDEGMQLIQKPYQRGDFLRRVRQVLDS